MAGSWTTIKVEDLTSGRVGFNWLGFQRVEDGSLLCASDTASHIGVFVWIVVLIVVIYFGLLAAP